MTVAAQLEQRIAETRSQLSENENELAQCKQERADLAVDDKPTVSLDKQIVKLEAAVKEGPHFIASLERKAAATKEAEAEQEISKLLFKQQKTADSMKKTSDALVACLGRAVDLNKQLLANFEEYTALKNQTHKDLASKNICQGSKSYLQYVYDYCLEESKGNHQPRQKPPEQFTI